MKRKFITMALATGLASVAPAHDEGHGPKLSDTGKYGGLVSPVVKKAELKLGSKAELLHKAELVRATDGTVRVYVYDKAMSPVDLKAFDKSAKATLGSKVKGKWKDTGFSLDQKDNAFVGKMPKAESKPYNIEVTLKQSGTELLSAFDNLD